jgi:hypothetical protein
MLVDERAWTQTTNATVVINLHSYAPSVKLFAKTTAETIT